MLMVTRKTLSDLRTLQKYAVTYGSCYNHPIRIERLLRSGPSQVGCPKNGIW